MIQSDIIAAMIDQIRPKFLAALAERLDRFEDIRALLGGPDETEAIIGELRLGLHRTAGLAATMGFAELGDMSRALELALVGDDMQNAPRPDFAAFLTEFDALLGEMALTLNG